MLINRGDRVRILEESHTIENYEVEPKGRTARVTKILFDGDGFLEMVVLKLDQPLDGLEHWNNELQYHRDSYDGRDFPSLAEVILTELEFLKAPEPWKAGWKVVDEDGLTIKTFESKRQAQVYADRHNDDRDPGTMEYYVRQG